MDGRVLYLQLRRDVSIAKAVEALILDEGLR
jgi:hypothetical protein